MPLSKKASKTNEKLGKAGALGNDPTTAYEHAKQQWFEIVGSPVVEKTRWFVVSFVLGFCLLGSIFLLNALLPLKTVEPYVIEVDRVTGEAKASPTKTSSYKPGEREVRYFIAQWNHWLHEIGPTTPNHLAKAFSHVRGAAVQEFKEFLEATNVFAEIKRDPNLRRTIEISSINIIQDGVALVRIVRTTRTMTGQANVKRFIANINYVLDPPLTDEDIQKNPIGFYVTHFDFRDELK